MRFKRHRVPNSNEFSLSLEFADSIRSSITRCHGIFSGINSWTSLVWHNLGILLVILYAILPPLPCFVTSRLNERKVAGTGLLCTPLRSLYWHRMQATQLHQHWYWKQRTPFKPTITCKHFSGSVTTLIPETFFELQISDSVMSLKASQPKMELADLCKL